MFIYGKQVAHEALSRMPGLVRKLYIDKPNRTEEMPEFGSVEVVSRDRLDELSDHGHHQGYVLDFQGVPYANLDDVVDGAPAEATILVLDQIQDPQNLGAILRAAAAFGVAAVVIPQNKAVDVTPATIRASAGMALGVRVCKVKNIAETLVSLRDQGFWSTALVMDGQPLAKIDFKGRAAVVVGSEGPGIRRLVQERCDFQGSIPMSPDVDSLNASTAAAIALYEVARQRHG